MSLEHRLQGRPGGHVLVLSNSLGTTQELWDRQLPELTERFHVLTYDHPGHGASELPERPCTVEALAHGLLALLDELDVDRVSFCGVSLGGMVGMALALEAPERVERLVLACTSAYLGPPEAWAQRAQDRPHRWDGGDRRHGRRALVHAGVLPRGAGDGRALPIDARVNAAGGIRALL